MIPRETWTHSVSNFVARKWFDWIFTGARPERAKKYEYFPSAPTSFLTESNESYLGSSQVRLTGGSQKPDYVGNPSQTETSDLRNSMTSELEIPSSPKENVNTKQEKKKNSWKY